MKIYKKITFSMTVFALVTVGAFFATGPAPDALQLVCPWQTPQEMVIEDKNFEQPERSLSKSEVIEDLLCLKDLMNHYYAAQLYYPDADIAKKIDALIAGAKPMANADLVSEAFSVTDDFYDLHLRFKLDDIFLMDSSQSTKKVAVEPALDTERTHRISNGYYF